MKARGNYKPLKPKYSHKASSHHSDEQQRSPPKARVCSEETRFKSAKTESRN